MVCMIQPYSDYKYSCTVQWRSSVVHTMPGYAVSVIYERAELVCAHCKLLLRNAVQTDEGVRLLQSCFKEIAW